MQSLSSLKGNRIKLIFPALILVFISITGISNAGDYNYSVTAIPSKLLPNSNSIVRFRNITLEVKSTENAILREHVAISILKDKAIDLSILRIPYGKFSSVKRLRGAVYNEAGERVEKIEQDQFIDLSAIADFSTYDDSRIIGCKPKYQTVPFTVEYSFEVDLDGIVNFPFVYLIDEFNQAVEQLDLSIMVDETLGIRYMEKNMAPTVKIAKEKTIEKYSWNFSNITSIREEPFSPPIQDLSPAVLLAPHSFEIKGHTGHNDDWKSFGLWIYNLIKERNDLSSETRQKMVEMTAGVADTLEKIRLLYHYLQNKTRYVSVQIGIGGLQPALASEVDRLGYGDCKALTNYMKSLLEAVGIRSFYTWVDAGREGPEIYPDFPSNQFNHIILCVPLYRDTVWLECTSQELPMGYLSSFTDDRPVVLIKEEGGFLCRTPRYDQEINVRSCTARFSLQENGDAFANGRIRNRGLYYDDTHDIIQDDATERRKKLIEFINLSDIELDSFNIREYKTGIPYIDFNVSLWATRVGIKAGDLMLLSPNQMSHAIEISGQIFKRTNPIEIRRSTLRVDTIFYELPEGLIFTGNHIDQKISSQFGDYIAKTDLEGRTLRYIRRLTMYKSLYPRESYADFLKFLELISTSDTKKIAMKVSRKE